MTEAVNRPPSPVSAPAPNRHRGRTAFRASLFLSLVGGTTVLVMQPEWLVGEGRAPESADVRSASGRMIAIEAVGRVKAFVGRTGHLPATLEAAGINSTGLTLHRLEGTTFEISTMVENAVVTFRSTDSLASVLADAVRALRGRQ
jgi:hypothetical protein